MKLVLDWIADICTYGLEKAGLYYSQYRGTVVDNEDPLNLARLKINVPQLHGDQTPNIWAYPLANYSGVGYGSQVIPQENDMVWVTFEHGKIRKPVWSHGHFVRGEKPTDLVDRKKYWFRTPEGLTILMDDNNKVLTLYEKDKKIEPMVLGDTLEEHLSDLIDIITKMQINTQLGPQSILPIWTQRLNELKDKLEKFKSQNNKLS